MTLQSLIDEIVALYELGGSVVVILLAISIVTLAVILFKAVQFRIARVGKHHQLEHALAAWDKGDAKAARSHLTKSRSHLSKLLESAFGFSSGAGLRERLEAQAERRIARLESGFRLLDSVAQLAPLLGLFGTVLGMIDAFQALQDAGSQVDPSILAGGIWVALLTTAAGLAVAMPTSVALSWFESRVDRDRLFAEDAIARALHRVSQGAEATEAPSPVRAYGT